TMPLFGTGDCVVYWECDRLRDVSHIRDLSMGGLCMQTRRSRPKSDLVHVHFLVAEGQVRLDGIVVRAQPNGLGLKFQSVTKEDIPQLTDLINRMRSTHLIAPVSCRLFDFFS